MRVYGLLAMASPKAIAEGNRAGRAGIVPPLVQQALPELDLLRGGQAVVGQGRQHAGRESRNQKPEPGGSFNAVNARRTRTGYDVPPSGVSASAMR